MRCASCGSATSPEARFCGQCGVPLTDGVGPREAAASDTGLPAGAAEAPGDRRVVTALFADLVDYVRMLAEHDPEVVRARVTAALATMSEAIARFDGTREKFIGDAVFAVFGWPRAHDDDAVRASLAALSIRARLQEIGDGVEPMEVRIGIATGEVVASAPGPSRDGDLGLTGEAITTAARIQSLARPGEILLEGATLRAARGRLAAEAHGSVVLRGQSRAVELFGLQGEVGMSTWTRQRSASAGPLVGRSAELARLRALIDRTRTTGVGGVATIVGEAGVGKTRLLTEIEADARRAGFAWTWTENVSYGRGEPYRFGRLFAQTVADEVGIDSGSLARRLLFTEDLSPDDVRRYGGAIAAIARDAAFSGWEEEASNTPSDPAEIAAALTEVAARYVQRLLEERGPRVVVVDDLHWLDHSSAGMVEVLVRAAVGHPLILLLGSRPGPLPDYLRTARAVAIELRGLREPETARLATLVARAAVDADGARRIHERTAGNPLFIGETVRAYLEDGTLEWRDGRVALIESGTPRLPVTLRAVLGARIDALDQPAREVLGVASVIGVRFDAATVGALAAREPPGRDILDRLADAAIIAPDGVGEWRFAHQLIHDVAYAGVLASRRRELHARLADHLTGQTVAAPLGLIATHRAAAGDVELALPLLRQAAKEAMALGAATEAAAFWRQAADLAEPQEPDAASRDRSLAEDALATRRPRLRAARDGPV